MEDNVINTIINSQINEDNLNDNSFMDVTIDSYSEVGNNYDCSTERNTKHTSILKSILKKEEEFINKKIYNRICKVFCGFCTIIVTVIISIICIIFV